MIKRALLLSTLAIAGCGGKDRLSKADYSAELQPRVDRVSSAFGSVFQALGKADEDAAVPADVRDKLRAAATTERAVAREIDALAEPEQAEALTSKLVAATRSQADELTQLAADRDLTVARMADAVEGGQVRELLADLQRSGYVRLSGH